LLLPQDLLPQKGTEDAKRKSVFAPLGGWFNFGFMKASV
jgi:hypothetical protein